MATNRPLAPVPLARQARERFVAHAEGVLAPLAEAIRTRLIELVDASSSTREMQDRRDLMLSFDRQRHLWVTGTQKAWHNAVVPPTATARVRLDVGSFELIGDEVVEKKILSSRLALNIIEKATWEINDLRLRMQELENGEELPPEDILRPEALSQLLVEQWTASELTRDTWVLVQDLIQQQMVERLVAAYHGVNEFLIQQGVMPDIDLSSRVKRGAATASRNKANGPGSAPPGGTPTNPGALGGESGPGGGYGGGGYGGGGPSGYQGGAGGGQGGAGGYGGASGGGGGPSYQGGAGGGQGGAGGYGGAGAGGPSGHQGGAAGGYAGGQGGGAGSAGGGYAGGGAGPAGGAYGGGGGGYGSPQGGLQGPAGAMGGAAGAYQGPGGGGGYAAGGPGGVADETRLMTSSTPLARARMRANGVVGQLKRLLVERVAGFDPDQHITRPSPALAEALSRHAPGTGHGGHINTQQGGAVVQSDVVYDDAAVERVAGDMRQRTGELKKKASTSAEKATIEIVALMFQSILAEDRIPPGVRVWFARLQMPVLRVALAEPEFFGTLQHPARQLIDRMGSCVMGFDASAIGGGALEAEIKRVVQVIEQYPETGRRVFQLVYDEFQKFLSRFLTEKGSTQRLVSVAQQVEQKETMAIQYTIEMRNMLNDMPVRDEIREFLFKVWAEVLAVAAVKNGPQHEETIALKKCASELVWAASAKPNRNDRARVIQDLPKLLQRLRQGMTLMGLQGPAQEAHIKVIGDTLADAFLSKTEAIPQARIEAMAKRLANLEDFVADDPSTDLPLDAESIELMLGIDASGIEVVADGGSKPTDAMLAWAMELQLGNWFTIDHNGKISNVQYVWRSERKQLHLFATTDDRSFLVQARRLAAYLQAGLLLPQEEEALTVRATRDALAKLDANPERLLS